MKNTTSNSMNSRKWEVVFEDSEHITVWRYNLDKTTKGPFEVELKPKKGYVHPSEVKKKTIGDLAKENRTNSKRLKS